MELSDFSWPVNIEEFTVQRTLVWKAIVMIKRTIKKKNISGRSNRGNCDTKSIEVQSTPAVTLFKSRLWHVID